ncbi:helix-turn-helix transcriptional regulator [Streptomyces sp. NPDC007094]|uniref:helix-turn-helix domain-containing protein n=1 Tax=Streptomyces sp. NPDC007094 TaxID=3155359 RepID=UPI0033F8E21E
MDHKTVLRIEYAITNLSLSRLFRLAAALEVEIAELPVASTGGVPGADGFGGDSPRFGGVCGGPLT